MLSTPQSFLCTEFARLTQARSWRDVFSLPGPVKIGDLQNPVNFASFRPKGSYKLLLTAGGAQYDDKDIEWTEPPLHYESNEEVLSLIQAFERENFSSRIKHWRTNCRRQLSNKLDQQEAIHADRADCPQGRLYLCANGSRPTHIVSHADTMDIFDAAMPGYLDEVFPPVHLMNLDIQFRENVSALRDRFQEAAVQMDSDAVYVMTGATVHFKPEGTKPGRVLFRAFVH